MTSNPNYIAPQSASAPITTNLRKDESAALLTVEQAATAEQRIVATGNSIPLVFCKQTGGIGGVWVTPPTARYGAEEDAEKGNYFAFGLIVSDGEIPAIAAGDVWKGPIKVNTLSNFRIESAYGSLPTTGYNYSRTVVTINTETFNYANTNVSFGFSGNSYTITVEGCTSFSFSGTRISGSPSNTNLNYFHKWAAYSDGTLIDSSGATESVEFNGAFSFESPVTFELVIDTSFSSYWPNPAYLHFSSLSYAYQVTTSIGSWPVFSGSGGSFAGMSTLAVKGRYLPGAEANAYRQQIRCFVRNGVQVDKVLGGTDSSCSFPDLAFYLLKSAGKVAQELIDLPSFQGAEDFNANYELFFNGVLANSVNLLDYLTRVAPLFMLRFTQINGKYALKPVLPIDSSFNIRTDQITPSYSFDDTNIVIGTYQKEYIDINQRKPFCALMTWRSQTESVYGTPKTNEVRYAGTAIDGPFEQYDMEEFCTTENHATLIGRYILASRKLITHTVAFQTTALISDLTPTDIIGVTWDYNSSIVAGENKTTLYQVDTVTEGADGVFRVEATHFPVTAAGVSQVALDMLTGI